jgi:hypothetical protein
MTGGTSGGLAKGVFKQTGAEVYLKAIGEESD